MKNILLICLLIISISIIINFTIGEIQNTKYNNYYNIYFSTVKSIEQQSSVNAVSDLEILVQKQPNRYNLHRTLGMAYAQTGQSRNASAQYAKALEIRPFLIKSALFNAQYAEVEYQNRNYRKSKVLFEEALRNGIDQKFVGYVNQMLERIKVIESRGN